LTRGEKSARLPGKMTTRRQFVSGLLGFAMAAFAGLRELEEAVRSLGVPDVPEHPLEEAVRFQGVEVVPENPLEDWHPEVATPTHFSGITKRFA